MGSPLFDIENLQPVFSEDALNGMKAQIRKMLVVDRVELVLLHQAKQMREFHRDDPCWTKEDFHPGDEIVDVRNVGKNIVSQEQVRPELLGDHLLGAARSEEFNS